MDYRQEVTSQDLSRMILQEGLPCLSVWSGKACGPHILLDCSFGEFDAKLAEFALNAFSAPQAVVTRHLPNQVNGRARHPRLPVAGSRLALPQQTKEVAMPAATPGAKPGLDWSTGRSTADHALSASPAWPGVSVQSAPVCF